MKSHNVSSQNTTQNCSYDHYITTDPGTPNNINSKTNDFPPKDAAQWAPGNASLPCPYRGIHTSTSSGKNMGCPQLMWNNLADQAEGGRHDEWGAYNTSDRTHVYQSIENIVKDLLITEMKLPASRMVLGLPFYGRYFKLQEAMTPQKLQSLRQKYSPPPQKTTPPVNCDTLPNPNASGTGTCYNNWGGGWTIASYITSQTACMGGAAPQKMWCPPS